MSNTIVLDSEAVSILAARRGDQRTNRLRSFLRLHLDDGGDVVIPANVVAETRRGNRSASVDRVLNAHTIVSVDRTIASLAGSMLEQADRNSADLTDATVAATAVIARSTGVIVLTAEQRRRSRPNDIETFCAEWAHKVDVLPISSI